LSEANFEVVPAKDDEKQWDIKILKGPFAETVVRIGAISYNEEDASIHFNFDVIWAPFDDDNELDPHSNVGLQETVGEIVLELLRISIEADNERRDDNPQEHSDE
jgi:hypothetical protein